MLDFDELRKANVERCNKFFHNLYSWTATDWACALAGEVGEACNFIKKELRGDGEFREDVAKELADIIVYTDLLAARYKIDLGEAVRSKFNEVSDRRHCPIKL